jgi:hypothetical protein
MNIKQVGICQEFDLSNLGSVETDLWRLSKHSWLGSLRGKEKHATRPSLVEARRSGFADIVIFRRYTAVIP